MMLKTEYKRVGREFSIESLAIKNIVSQIKKNLNFQVS